MITTSEYKEAVKTLTPFQLRVLEAIKSGPNQAANTWEIAWNGFVTEWATNKAGHGAMFRNIINAGRAMQKKGIVSIISPQGQHDTYTFCDSLSWLEWNEKQ